MAELKPCPFCGRMPKVEDCGEHRYFVKCKCGVEQSRLYGQKCDAVRHWNRRKTEPETEPTTDCRQTERSGDGKDGENM